MFLFLMMSLAVDGLSPKPSKSLRQTAVDQYLLKGPSKRIRHETMESVTSDALPNDADCVTKKKKKKRKRRKKEKWIEPTEDSNRPLANGFKSSSSLKVVDRSALQFHTTFDITASLGEVVNGNDSRGMFHMGVESTGSRAKRLGSSDSTSSTTSIANISICNYALSNCV